MTRDPSRLIYNDRTRWDGFGGLFRNVVPDDPVWFKLFTSSGTTVYYNALPREIAEWVTSLIIESNAWPIAPLAVRLWSEPTAITLHRGVLCSLIPLIGEPNEPKSLEEQARDNTLKSMVCYSTNTQLETKP